MYILKNAWISIKRNKGRNILITVIIFIIACATTVSLAIKNSSKKIIKSYEDSTELTATIEFNRESMMQNFNKDDESSKESMKEMFNNSTNLTVDEIKTYGNSTYLKSYYYILSTGVNSDSLESVSNDFGKPKDNNDEKKNLEENNPNQQTTDFTLSGYSSYESMTDFINGNYKITDGYVSNDFNAYNCVINSELATLNNISINNTITITNPNNNKNYTLTVTGIFSDNNSTSKMEMFSNSINNIITNTKVLEDIFSDDKNLSLTVNPTFILKNKDSLNAFTNEIKEKGLNNNLTLKTNEDEVKQVTSTISNIAKYATTFLIITLVIGTIVLFVINMINIRERKYEIGVLRTIGMKKKTLILQFIFELSTISLIALLLGAGVGSCISVPISNNLLQNEITSSNETAKQINDNFGKNVKNDNMNFNHMGVKTIQAYSPINATVDITTLLELLAIGIGLTIISSSAAMINIQKFSPLTILKERS